MKVNYNIEITSFSHGKPVIQEAYILVIALPSLSQRCLSITHLLSMTMTMVTTCSVRPSASLIRVAGVLILLCELCFIGVDSLARSGSTDLLPRIGPIPIEDHIRSFGYPVETHDITTEDGYVLSYHRIPHGKGNHTDRRARRPVLVQHGLMANSPVWVSVKDSLGFVLADAGFDVWLGNARGNTYSRKHLRYDPDKDKTQFWSFSWHEMGYYDLPASIDYILNTTSHKKLFYVGHSMGTTMYFVLGATRPQYMDKVEAAVLLAPVVFLNKMPSPIFKIIHSIHRELTAGLKALGAYEFCPFSAGLYNIIQHVCGNEHFQFLCKDFLFLVCGFDEEELIGTNFTAVLQYLPGGTSINSLEHYNQIVRKGFMQFDYGHEGNERHYHLPTPPSYDLGLVSSPLYVYYAPNDWISPPDDMFYSMGHLTSVRALTRVSYDKFNHGDFMWAKHAKSLVYDHVVKQLRHH